MMPSNAKVSFSLSKEKFVRHEQKAYQHCILRIRYLLEWSIAVAATSCYPAPSELTPGQGAQTGKKDHCLDIITRLSGAYARHIHGIAQPGLPRMFKRLVMACRVG
jgi:hypothetical protein